MLGKLLTSSSFDLHHGSTIALVMLYAIMQSIIVLSRSDAAQRRANLRMGTLVLYYQAIQLKLPL